LTNILTISEFIGRLHPLVVHLPVGILLLAVLLYFLSFKNRFAAIRNAVPVTLLAGTATAILSCITGFILSKEGDYSETQVSRHQWFGIGVAIAATVLYFLYNRRHNLVKWMMIVLVLLIFITGHLGGSLTHGEGYLTQALFSAQNNNMAAKPILNIQQADVYADIVQPILAQNCYNCHGPNKQKGKLRLDDSSFIKKGGEEGRVIVAGNTAESELIRRMLLPLDNDDHMPPKEKPQPSKAQIELLQWWVNTGAAFHQKVSALPQPEYIKTYLAALQTGNTVHQQMQPDIPDKEVSPADKAIIEKLRALNVAITPIAQNSNYLSVNFVAVDTFSNQHAQLLQQLSKNIVWLKINGLALNDAALYAIGALHALTRLTLSQSVITDNGLQHLKNLTQLQYLNLAGTAIADNGWKTLQAIKSLRQLYLFKTGIEVSNLIGLQQQLPKAIIDTGGYTVAFLETDTMLVKPKTK
jgi:uncharacterized membrane protein/mono/diheme cytochrome c family protein